MQELYDILPILSCPECQGAGELTLEEAETTSIDEWRQLLPSENSFGHQLTCQKCCRKYPVTTDSIPILWSDTLRRSFVIHDKINSLEPDELNVKAANIYVYESTIAEYSEAGIHADFYTEQRFLATIRASASPFFGWHIDVGCGGGNILRMAKTAGFQSQIGIDISLSALRLVMNKGFFVLVGDAERLPIKASSVSLLTASSVLHHLYEPSRLIMEAARVLNHGGILYTDFDPNALAAEWGWLIKYTYKIRYPVYRLLAKIISSKVSHKDQSIQQINKVAEFHNKPGSGFKPQILASIMESVGFEVKSIFLHNKGDASISNSPYVKPTLRHLVIQSFSGRNPFLRKNANTIMTVSLKS